MNKLIDKRLKMKNGSKFNLQLSALSLGVLGLFSVSAAMADDEEVKALTQPKSSVQVEMIGVDQNSAKFGEYNGLYGNKSGAYPNGGINLRGGSAYTNNEQGDTTRWSVTGENLGLTSRSANASIADQGSWNFGVNFDQLQHNISNSYQTPYSGSMGGNQFILPSNLSSPNGLNKALPVGQLLPTGVGTNSSVVSSDLQNMGISTTRYNTTVSGTSVVDKNLNFTFEYNNLIQTGAKLMAFGGSTYGNGTGSNSGNSQTISILPNPTNYQTDTLNLAVNWKGDDSFITASYFGSFFKDNYNAVNWQVFSSNASGATALTPMQTMSTAPSNSFNQFNLNGGYDFSAKTKLTSNISFGQNTQNQGFGGTYDAGMITPSLNSTLKSAYVLPSSSMNGLVNSTHADVKVTDQSIKDLNLSATAKYDQRDNLTQSNIYNFSSLGGTSGLYPNTPMSNKQVQVALAGDYRLTKDQKLNLTLGNNNIDRWCNQYGATNTLGGNAANYPTGTNCANASSSNENVANLTYKIKATEDLNLKATAGYSNRKTQWNQQALASFVDTNINGGSYAPGYNGGNIVGFQPFFEASRKQFLGKASASWQATDKLDLTLGGKYTSDLYPDSTYGVQNGNSWSLNLDSTYAYAEDGAISAYATQQNQFRSLTNLNSLSTGSWNNTLGTKTTTLGLGIKQAGLVDGKLTLTGDATMSFANSQYGTQIGYPIAASTSNGVAVAAGCSSPSSVYTCGLLPGIQNNLAIIKLGGSYQLDKNSKIGLMYWYQHLYSNDYFYNAYQYGSTPTAVMPTNQSNPSYNVNVFAVNYTYSFD
jgi:MtrB/PioB family decaheme-associated outer membrane protein